MSKTFSPEDKLGDSNNPEVAEFVDAMEKRNDQSRALLNGEDVRIEPRYGVEPARKEKPGYGLGYSSANEDFHRKRDLETAENIENWKRSRAERNQRTKFEIRRLMIGGVAAGTAIGIGLTSLFGGLAADIKTYYDGDEQRDKKVTPPSEQAVAPEDEEPTATVKTLTVNIPRGGTVWTELRPIADKYDKDIREVIGDFKKTNGIKDDEIGKLQPGAYILPHYGYED
jgi:hypothetical protein